MGIKYERDTSYRPLEVLYKAHVQGQVIATIYKGGNRHRARWRTVIRLRVPGEPNADSTYEYSTLAEAKLVVEARFRRVIRVCVGIDAGVNPDVRAA